MAEDGPPKTAISYIILNPESSMDPPFLPSSSTSVPLPLPSIPNPPTASSSRKLTSSARGQKRKLAQSRSSTPQNPSSAFELESSPNPSEQSESSVPAAGLPGGGIAGNFRGAITGGNTEDARLNRIARMGSRIPGTGDRDANAEEECFQWTDMPMNRLGFRYIPCANGPYSPRSTAPGVFPFFRRIPAPSLQTQRQSANDPLLPSLPPDTSLKLGGVHLDWLDRSSFLRISADAMTCTADKGFRSVRTNVGVKEGNWYFECKILKGQAMEREDRPSAVSLPKGNGAGDGPHVRIGWGRREASLNGPCGLDAYSYAIRDSSGEKVTLSRPQAYGKPFGTGDVIGCMISLPTGSHYDIQDVEEREKIRAAVRQHGRRNEEGEELGQDMLNPGRIVRKRFPLHYKGQHYFEMLEYPVAKEMEALVARDGRSAREPLIPPGTDVNANAPPSMSNGARGSPAKIKGKPNGPMTKNTMDGKGGKLVKKSRKKKKDGDDDPDKNKPKELKVLKGSRIDFFLNGEPMAAEPAFMDIFDFLPLRQTEKEAKAREAYEGVATADALLKQKENPFDDGTLGYYPFVSCFGGAKVKFNAGPHWEYPPNLRDVRLSGESDDAMTEDFPPPRPVNDRWAEFRAEERFYDECDDEAEWVRLMKYMEEKSKEKDKRLERASHGKGGKKGKNAKKARPSSSLATELFDTRSNRSSPAPESTGAASQTHSRASTPFGYAGGAISDGDSDAPLSHGAYGQPGMPSSLGGFVLNGMDHSSPAGSEMME